MSVYQEGYGPTLPRPRRRGKAKPKKSTPRRRHVRTAVEILHEHEIEVTDATRRGQHYARCPKCSDLRSRKNQRRNCLAVMVGDKGVRWMCNNGCGFKGGAFYLSWRLVEAKE